MAQPARDAPLVGMEEKIPILYYNTIDSDIREEKKIEQYNHQKRAY